MTRVYNAFTHYDAAPLRIRATSPKAALAIALELTAQRVPQFRTIITEIPCNGEAGGSYTYRECRALETPYAVRANDQQSATAN